MSEKPKSFVNRSEYQRVCEENKRLKRHLHQIIEEPLNPKTFDIKNKYREEYKKDRELVNSLSLMVGGTYKTKDGYSLQLSENVFKVELMEALDDYKWKPVEMLLIEALNDNEKEIFKVLENCQEYCDRLNSISDELNIP